MRTGNNKKRAATSGAEVHFRTQNVLGTFVPKVAVQYRLKQVLIYFC